MATQQKNNRRKVCCSLKFGKSARARTAKPKQVFNLFERSDKSPSQEGGGFRGDTLFTEKRTVKMTVLFSVNPPGLQCFSITLK